MIELAIAGNAQFQASRADADRPGPHYTIDMVRAFQGRLPTGGELYFLMGYDSLADCPPGINRTNSSRPAAWSR